MINHELFGKNHGHRFYTDFVRATIGDAEVGAVIRVGLDRSEVEKFRMTATKLYGPGTLETRVESSSVDDKRMLFIRRIG